jgi:aminopeptidase
MQTDLNSPLQSTAKKNIQDIISICFDHDDSKHSVIVYDTECELAKVLAAAYKQVLPSATFINFYETTPDDILKLFSELKAKDLVVLIQSTNFRLNAFRIRVELFKQNLKVIEHPRLNRMIDDQINYYIDSLAYDPNYYRRVGPALKNKIDTAKKCTIDSGGEFLIYDSIFETAKLNIGDYSEMKNIGGQFPIGEVFTEPKNLDSVSGRANIFCFGDTSFNTNTPEIPITLIIEKGQIISCENSTEEFETVLKNIRTDEGVVRIRELGFGMNRAFTKDRVVTDIGTYERMCGIHLSLGAKHDSYAKPDFKRGVGRHHVDVFLVTESVILETENGPEIVYKDAQWCV